MSDLSGRPPFTPNLWVHALVGVLRRAGGADQLVRLQKNIVVFRLFSGKEADADEDRAEHQPHEHDPAVRAFVGIMK
jgi:hypothetical protein